MIRWGIVSSGRMTLAGMNGRKAAFAGAFRPTFEAGLMTVSVTQVSEAGPN